MKYINKLNIDFNQWDKLKDDDLFNEDYVLSQLNDNKKNNYLFLKNFLLENNIFNKFFKNLIDDNLTNRFDWHFYLIKNKVKLTNENKIIYFLNINPKQDLIDLSFDWSLSKEKHGYWLSIKYMFVHFNK